MAQPDRQEPPSKARLRLWLKMLKATHAVEHEIRGRMRRECNTTLPRFDVMSALERAPKGLKMSEISKLLRVSNGNVTGIVDALTVEGLALRVALDGDRRAHLVRLTEKGRAAFQQQARAHKAWVDEILGNLEEEDVENLTQSLDHLSNALKMEGPNAQ